MKISLFIYSAAFLLSSCMVKQSGKNMLPAFDKQGHRGCRGLMPENTLLAMLKASDLGVTTLEMDAVISKDGKVVLSHEPFFNHEITTKPNGAFVTEAEERSLNLYQLSYDEIKRFDVGSKPHPRFPRQEKLPAIKPLLSDVIASVESYTQLHKRMPLYYNIETKSDTATDGVFHPAPERFVDLLMDVIKQRQIANRVIIQSFDFRTLQVVRKKYPGIMTAMLIEDYDKRSLDEQLKALQFTPTIYSPEQSHVTAQLVKDCHKKKMKIIPWTVNDKASIERLKAMGVDGIITDYPDLF